MSGSLHRANKNNKTLIRPTGLTEALWACVLDDYLSEEEEGEINKVIGYKEKTPWYLSPDTVACAGPRPTRRRHVHDPRDPKERGGRINANDSSDDERDGTPGVWDDLSSAPELPPVMWLSVPPKDDAADEHDWDTGTDDWDANVTVQPNNMERAVRKRAKSGNRRKSDESSTYHEAVRMANAKSRQPAKPISRNATRSPSRQSDKYRTMSSHSSSDVMSRMTPFAKSKPSRSRSRSKSRTRNSRNTHNDDLESRQTQQSRRGGSRTRRQSTGRPLRSRTSSPHRDLKKKNSTHRDTSPIGRSTLIKEQQSLKRVPSQGLRARLREALVG